MKFKNNQCESLIRSNAALDSSNYWLVGTPFYRAFEISHDMERLVLGFRSIKSPSSSSQLAPLKEASNLAVLLRSGIFSAIALVLVSAVF